MSEQIELYPIESPCIGICQSNKKGYCFGCFRSRQERQSWFDMTNEERRKVIRLLVGRKNRLEAMKRRQKEQLPLAFETKQETENLFVLT